MTGVHRRRVMSVLPATVLQVHSEANNLIKAVTISPSLHVNSRKCTKEICTGNKQTNKPRSSYYNARGLFACSLYKLAPKCPMPTERRMGHVLREQPCDYLFCGRRMCEVFLSRGNCFIHTVIYCMHYIIRRKKCYGGLAKISWLRDRLPAVTKKRVYNALVLPHLDYCCVVWQECGKVLQ